MVKFSVRLSAAVIAGLSATIGLTGAASFAAVAPHQGPTTQAHCLHVQGASRGEPSAARQRHRTTKQSGSIVVSIPRVVFIRTAADRCVSITTNTGELPQPADIFYDLRSGSAVVASSAVRSWVLRSTSHPAGR